MNEPTGDCYEIDQAPSGAVDHVWHRLEELADAIVHDGRRMPRNLWGLIGKEQIDILPA